MPTRFCLHCGAPLVLGRVDDRERLHCPECGHIHYQNPTPVGMAVAVLDRRLLLIRRANPPLQGYWAPPAGHVEMGESVEAATIRETQEEAGVEVALDGLAGVYSQADVGVVIIAYHGRIVGGKPQAGEDAAEAGLFTPGDLPPHPFPQSASAVDRWFYDVVKTITAPWRQSRVP